MPYINPDRRAQLMSPLAADFANTPGELNYMFTREIRDYVEHNGLNYHTINDILGALEGAKLEFYRRVVVPYENVKLTENGDVY